MLNFKNKNTYIIAEEGVNHNGSLKIAKKLIISAKKAGADAIKFQIFNSNELVSKNAKKAPYQIKNTKSKTSQLSMLRNLELDKKDFKKLLAFTKKIKIDFIASVFDEESLNFLVNILKQKIIKIPSGEITNFLLLKKINLNKNQIILSTGMSNMQEIVDAINVIAKKNIYKILNKKIKIIDKKLHKEIKQKLFILHCTTDYPVEDKYVNLNCIDQIKKDLDLIVGYSDHTKDYITSLISVVKSAKIIEKHFTLDKNLYGPDHIASLDPLEFAQMVKYIRRSKNIMGSSKKIIQKCELKNRTVVRKSLIAKNYIKKNQKFELKDISAKRPANGIPPIYLDKVIGKKAKKNFKKEELIKL
jgi:sialic acid synthase SpsE